MVKSEICSLPSPIPFETQTRRGPLNRRSARLIPTCRAASEYPFHNWHPIRVRCGRLRRFATAAWRSHAIREGRFGRTPTAKSRPVPRQSVSESHAMLVRTFTRRIAAARLGLRSPASDVSLCEDAGGPETEIDCGEAYRAAPGRCDTGCFHLRVCRVPNPVPAGYLPYIQPVAALFCIVTSRQRSAARRGWIGGRAGRTEMEVRPQSRFELRLRVPARGV